MNSFKQWISAALILFITCTLNAQITKEKRSVYFDTDKAELTLKSQKILSLLLDSFLGKDSLQLVIYGNTDNRGGLDYNQELSERRVASVQTYFSSRGVTTAITQMKSFGETAPLADNKTAEGKQINRRVDIWVSYQRSVEELQSIWELYKKIESQGEVIVIDPAVPNVIKGENGTLVKINANTFNIPSSCRGEKIQFTLKEYFSYAEMIANNISTTSNDRVLETQGMIYTEAKDCKGRKLKVLPGKQVTILFPTVKRRNDMRLFSGERRAKDSIMNWKQISNNILHANSIDDSLDGFDVLGANNCAKWRGCGGGIQCNCRLFLCRIGRLPESIAGIFNRCTRKNNQVFRRNLKNCKLNRKSTSEGRSKRIEKNRTKVMELMRANAPCFPTPRDLMTAPPVCEALALLFERYGVTEYGDLIIKINQHLLDSFGLTTMEELRDTLEKIKIRQIEMDLEKGDLELADYQYYIFNTSNLGYINCDAFTGFKKSDLINLHVKLKREINTDCKLVFKNQRTVLPASIDKKGNYVFYNVPKGEKVYLVALKYKNSKPFLSMNTLNISGKKAAVSFVSLTLVQLKKKLKLLNELE